MTTPQNNNEILVITEVRGKVAIVTLNRPAALNALNEDLLVALRANLLETIKNGVQVVVLTGAGEKSFVAGADITKMQKFSPLEARSFVELGQGVMQILEEAPVVTIAAVNGFALGGGLELAIACDLIYASENSKFGAPETNLGIVPGFGGTLNIPTRIGFHRAMDLILTGRTIGAEEAKNWGLVLEIFPKAELMPKVLEIAEKLAKKGKHSLMAAKRLVRSRGGWDRDRAYALERETFATLFSSNEPKEGMTAFVEKREAKF